MPHYTLYWLFKLFKPSQKNKSTIKEGNIDLIMEKIYATLSRCTCSISVEKTLHRDWWDQQPIRMLNTLCRFKKINKKIKCMQSWTAKNGETAKGERQYNDGTLHIISCCLETSAFIRQRQISLRHSWTDLVPKRCSSDQFLTYHLIVLNHSELSSVCFWIKREMGLLMSLQQQRSPLAAADVPHDHAVIRGAWEEQPLDGIPPQGSNASCKQTTVLPCYFPLHRFLWHAGATRWL